MSSLDHQTGLRDRLRARPAFYGSIAVAAIAFLVVVLVVFQPQRLLYDNVVDEAFPVIESSTDVATATDDDAENDPTDADTASTDADTASTDDATGMDDGAAAARVEDEPTGSDAMMDDDPGAAPQTADTDADDIEDAAAESDGTEVEAEPEPSGPLALASGDFISRSRYTVTGDATVYELEDGSRTLRLENFESTNGPALFVYLTSADDDAPDAQLDADFIDLGELRGNIGNQNYDIPADVDLDVYDTVVIWCRPFTVAFGAADLS